MSNIEKRLSELETKNEQLRKCVKALEKNAEEKTDENAVKVLVDEYLNDKNVLTENQIDSIIEKILTDKKYMTETEVHNLTKETHLTILRWVIATVLSAGAVTFGFLRIFL
ncbi:hypothetical protein [Bacillus sp. FJAT-45350]|uniref:hypothetical protein n=1 Tax=Bacillus sp. FJAT-45350 TaxID=2011014 RepID=UPI000BB84DE8|nr:hypothetical protein [Bacillus sp. FJAT-45350]